jgi:RNA polymerase sigma factor (sigma-70 family)
MNLEQLLTKNLTHLKTQCRSSAFKYKIEYEDILSESLERIWKHRKRFRYEEGDVGFRKWCSLVVRNVTIDLYRINRRHKVVDRHFNILMYSDRVSRQNLETEDYLQKVFEYLKYRWGGKKRKNNTLRIIEMTAFGYKIEEIAQGLSISEGTVKSVVHRVRIDLKKKLK